MLTISLLVSPIVLEISALGQHAGHVSLFSKLKLQLNLSLGIFLHSN
jgi:hypothetical protein